MSFWQAVTTVNWFALIGLLLPPIVAFVTSRETHPGWQGTLMAFLAAVLGVVQQGVSGGLSTGQDWLAALVQAIVPWILAQVSHSNFWKPTGTTARLQAAGPQTGAHRATPAKTT